MCWLGFHQWAEKLNRWGFAFERTCQHCGIHQHRKLAKVIRYQFDWMEGPTQ